MYRSGNVELGASVKGWMDQFSGLLTAAGWTVAEDLFIEEAPEGSRLFAPSSEDGNGYLEVFVNNAVTRLRMVKTAKRRFATRSVERAHDLANGFNYFADLSAEHVAVILETPAGVSTPMVAGVKTPDALSPAWAGQGMTPPRGFTCEPVEDQVSVTHHLVATKRSTFSSDPNGAYTAQSGHNHQSNWYSLRAQPTNDSQRVTELTPGLLEISESIYPPSLIVGESSSLNSTSFALLVAYAGWSALPGVYLTNAAAGDRVAVLGDDADTLYGGGGRVLAADLAADADSVSVPSDGLPETGVLRVNQEYLSYNAKSEGTLSGLSRGLYGTEAAAHEAAAGGFSDDFSGDLTQYDIDNDGADVTLQDGALRFTNPSRTLRYPRLYAPLMTTNGAVQVVADMSGYSANEGVALIARENAGTYVYCEITPSHVYFYEQNGATKTSLGSTSVSNGPFALDATHTLRLEARGRALRLFVDDEFYTAARAPEGVRGRFGVGGRVYETNRPVVVGDLIITPDPTRVYLGSWWVKSGSAVIAAGGEKP